jgi:hypothetical protein
MLCLSVSPELKDTAGRVCGSPTKSAHCDLGRYGRQISLTATYSYRTDLAAFRSKSIVLIKIITGYTGAGKGVAIKARTTRFRLPGGGRLEENDGWDFLDLSILSFFSICTLGSQ